MKEDNYLISIVCKGKIVELYYSHDLCELGALKAMHKDCDVEVLKIKEPDIPKPAFKPTGKLTRNGKPWANRVQCVETGLVYDSVVECSKKTGIPIWSLYKSVHKGYMASGYHFSLLPPDEKSEKHNTGK